MFQGLRTQQTWSWLKLISGGLPLFQSCLAAPTEEGRRQLFLAKGSSGLWHEGVGG